MRVRARNYWGWGEFSDILTIKASSFPEQVSQPSTAIDEVTGGIRVQWTAPFNNAEEITKYKIEAESKTGDWIEICTLNNIASMLITTRCIEPMQTFVDPTGLNLVFGDIVKVRVSAFNKNGWGLESIPNTQGEYVRTAPTFMNPPLRNPLTNDL